MLTADLALSPAMPLLKHLPLQLQQPPVHLVADAGAFRDGYEITVDVGPTTLASLQGQPAEGAIAIRDHEPIEGLTQNLSGHLG